MIQCKVKGDWKKTKKFLQKSQKLDLESLLKQYAEEGLTALKAATPVRTGKTADSWAYEIEKNNGKIAIYWTNTNVNENVHIAVILEYGHGTGWGGYVQGKHYISSAIEPVFDRIVESIWKEVARD